MAKKSKKPAKPATPQLDREDVTLIDENGRPFDIPVEGSLGLLALGARGLLAWRKKRGPLKKRPLEEKTDQPEEKKK